MKRKGSSQNVALFIVGVVVVGVIASLGVDRIVDLDERIKVRTVEIPGERVSTAIHTIDALDKAEVQIDLKDEYGLEMKKEGEKHLNYTADTVIVIPGSDYGSYNMDPPVEFEIKEGIDDSICIEKEGEKSNPVVKPGEC